MKKSERLKVIKAREEKRKEKAEQKSKAERWVEYNCWVNKNSFMP